MAGAERAQSARAEIFLRGWATVCSENASTAKTESASTESAAGKGPVEASARRGRNQAPLTLNTSEATSPQIAKTTDRRVLRVRY